MIRVPFYYPNINALQKMPHVTSAFWGNKLKNLKAYYYR